MVTNRNTHKYDFPLYRKNDCYTVQFLHDVKKKHTMLTCKNKTYQKKGVALEDLPEAMDLLLILPKLKLCAKYHKEEAKIRTKVNDQDFDEYIFQKELDHSCCAIANLDIGIYLDGAVGGVPEAIREQWSVEEFAENHIRKHD